MSEVNSVNMEEEEEAPSEVVEQPEPEPVEPKEDAAEETPTPSVTSEIESLGTEPSINTSVIDTEDTSEETKDDEQTKRSRRELKLLLALSKEANLNTNISHKRKSMENTKYKDTYVIKDIKDEKIKKTPKPSPEGKVIRYPVTAETELEEAEAEPKEEIKVEKVEKVETPVKIKRKKESAAEAVIGGAIEEYSKKSRKSSSSEIIMFKPDKDKFCWRCHRDNVNIACETCPRTYHQKCLKQTITDIDHWPCPECVEILKAESTQTRSEAMKGMDLEHLCSLLKHAVKRMIQCSGAEPFIHAVNEKDFPDYKKYIIQPMDLTLLDKNIKQNLYGSTQAFEADAKWILHNSIIYNSYQSKLTTVAKNIVKICKQEMAEIENCPSCYLNANTKKDWFVQVCPKPHLLLWAKLKGFPYWPAKLMCSNNSGMVDVRFFGAHDKAWVSYKDCYLYSLKDPNSYKQKRYDIDQCTKELDIYVRNLRRVFGEVKLAAFKATLVPDNEAKHLQELLPKYSLNTNYKILIKQIYDEGSSQNSSLESEDLESNDKNNDNDESIMSKSPDVDSTMEGYGTDDEIKSGTTRRRGMRKMISDDTMDSEEIEEVEKVENEEESSDRNSPNPVAMRGRPRSRRFSNIVRTNSTDRESSANKLKRRNSEISNKSIDTEKSEEKLDKESVDDSKVKPIEITVDNAEISISPKSKLQITDKLMKKLSDSDLEKQIIADEGSKKEEDAMEVSSTSEKADKMNVDDEKQNSKEDKKSASESTANKLVSEDVQTILEEFNDDEEDEDDADSSFDDIPLAQAVKKQKSEEITLTRIIPREVEVKETEEPKKPEPTKKKSDDSVVEVTRKRKKSSDEMPLSHNKVTLVSIDKILKKKILSTPKIAKKADVEEVVIKSEPESSEESDSEYMEKKREYLSALNISEKTNDAKSGAKPHEIRTRSKTEEKANKHKVDDVEKKKKPGPLSKKDDVGEISVKSFAKLAQNSAKPKARRSLPLVTKFSSPSSINKEAMLKKHPPPLTELSRPNTNKNTTPNKNSNQVVNVTNSVSLIKTPKSNLPNSSPNKNEVATTIPKSSTSFDTLRPGLVFLAPTSEVMLLPTSSALSYTNANSILSLIPPPLTASNPLIQTRPIAQGSQSANNHKDLVPSQNFIPQGEPMEQDDQSQPTNALLTTLLDKRSQNEGSRAEIGTDRNASETIDLQQESSQDLNLLNGYSPQTLSKAVTDLMSRPPPKLKPRPPGALSTVFEEANPSSAGVVTAKINSIAHRLGDYFRGMLIETLDNLGQSNNFEATITSLKLEIETLKHKHEVEMSEVKKNVSTVLEDIQKSIIEEKERIISDTRAACEAETIRRVDEAKSKQWCANCSEEAQFYCCWNTSYCDYPCQQKHWVKHMNKCTQSFNQPSTAVTLRQPNQPIVLRPTNPPANKQNVGRIITSKPTKVYMNRMGGTPKAMQAFKRNGNHLTLVEASPGNYELINSSGVPISMAGKIIKTPSLLTKIKSGSVSLTTTNSSPGSRSSVRSTPSSINSDKPQLISDDDSD